jgi:hypothetical protein
MSNLGDKVIAIILDGAGKLVNEFEGTVVGGRTTPYGERLVDVFCANFNKGQLMTVPETQTKPSYEQKNLNK